MFYLWRIIKRNPIAASYRTLGFCFLGYLTLGVVQSYSRPIAHNLDNYCEPHTEDYDERLRQFNKKKLLLLRNTMYDLRAKQDVELRAIASSN